MEGINPVVSVLVPIFNSASYVEEAVYSVINQTFRDFEILLIDDGSTDDTEAILHHLIHLDNRIRLVQREHRGLTESLNEGIRLARGEYIARMDSDDFSRPSRLEKQIKFLNKYPSITVCGCSMEIYEKPGHYWKVPLEHEAIMARMLFECCLFHPTTMFRKSIVSEFGCYSADRAVAQDYDLWQRMGASGRVRFANLKEPLVRYRTHPELDRSMYKNRQKISADKVRSNFLKQLNIMPSYQEFICHAAFSYPYSANCNCDLEACSNWLDRLGAANKQHKVIVSDYLNKELQYRWTQLCLNISRNNFDVALTYLKSPHASRLSRGLYNASRMGWRRLHFTIFH